MSTDPNRGTEVWGRCASCARWFYCGHTATAVESAACPVCAAPPVQIEHRLAETST